MIAAGICVSVQGPVNARLRLAVASPVFSATVSFLSGTLVLAFVMATGALGGTGLGLSGLSSAPPWAFLGGALGATFVLGSIIAMNDPWTSPQVKRTFNLQGPIAEPNRRL